MILMASLSRVTADQLRDIRKKFRFTQIEMANFLGVHRGAYKNWEYGLSKFPQELEARLAALANSAEAGPPLVPIAHPASAVQPISSLLIK